ncbi:hypothetical protein Lfu02_42270 [Longispora fulva]|nr:hypothetical protein Lfu02_42270 [Longispora fulva]
MSEVRAHVGAFPVDEEYPTRLRSIKQMPPIVFTQGAVEPDAMAIAVVGSRDAESDRLHVAGVIARTLVNNGVTVVSGLARD